MPPICLPATPTAPRCKTTYDSGVAFVHHTTCAAATFLDAGDPHSATQAFIDYWIKGFLAQICPFLEVDLPSATRLMFNPCLRYRLFQYSLQPFRKAMMSTDNAGLRIAGRKS